MSRRAEARETGHFIGSREDKEEQPKKRRWLFPAVAGGIAALWLLLNLPRTEGADETIPLITKRAGWPDSYSRWSVSKTTGDTVYSTFSTSGLLSDLVVLAIPIVIAWVIIRHIDKSQEQPEDKHRGKPRPTRSGETQPPYPYGGASSTGGWG